MNNLFIRSYIPSDKEKIKELYVLGSVHSEIGYEEGPWFKDFQDVEEYYKGGDFLVGLIDDEIVAMVGLQKITDTKAHVRRMRVHPDHRRKGYAQALLNALEGSAKKNGFQELRLRTSTQQKMAQGLYEKKGYTKIETEEKEYYSQGGGNTFEVIWYRKEL